MKTQQRVAKAANSTARHWAPALEITA